MPLSPVERTNFSAGQIDADAQKDRAQAVCIAGCKKAKNLRILNGGGVKRRPGTWRRLELTNGKSVGVEYTSGEGDVFKLLFSNAQVDIVGSSNTIVQTVASCPWGSDILDELYFDLFDGSLTVAHWEFWPQVISVSGGTWSVDDFAFDAAFSGGPAQPYYRYAAKGMTLQPSAVTGSVTLTASAALFDAGHVGAYIRYLGYAMLVTAVTSNVLATATVQTSLPTTVTFNVADPTGFSEDESCGGIDSGAKGIITNISGSTLTVVYTLGLTGFTNGEVLVGDSSNSQSTITSAPTPTSPAAVEDWDEQVFSAVRGYPGGVRTHRGRLYFFNFRDLPRGVAASEAGEPSNFLTGANDGDAFFELVPDYSGQRVRHILTAEQGLVLTDKAIYYLPEYGTQVVTPSTIDFKLVGTVGAAALKPSSTERGFAFVEEGDNRVVGILPTGNIYAPWEITDVSTLWTELVTGPRALAPTVAITAFPERYVFVLNDDGTAACVKYQATNANVPVGWTPWETNGAFRSMFSAGGALYAVVQRLIDSVEVWTLEEFDEDLYIDNCVSFATALDTIAPYEGATVCVMSGTWYRGSYDVDGSGALVDFVLDDGSYVAGLDMIMEFEPTTPTPEHPAYRFGQRIAIPRAWLHVIETGSYSIGGQLSATYRTGEDNDAAPPLRTEARRWRLTGRDADLSPYITQYTPAPFEVLALNMEVSF